MIIYRRLADSLTFTRLLLIFPILISLHYNLLLLFWILFLIGGITDLLDGYFARLSNTTSSWGAKYDPFADKLLIISPLIWFASQDIVPFWSVVLIVARDLLVTNNRTNDAKGKPAIPIAKVKTFMLFISILLLSIPCCYIPFYYFYYLSEIAIVIYWLSIVVVIYSGIKYTVFK